MALKTVSNEAITNFNELIKNYYVLIALVSITLHSKNYISFK